MGSKTRLGSYCTKRANNGVNLVTSRNINTRLARPIGWICEVYRHNQLRLPVNKFGDRGYDDAPT